MSHWPETGGVPGRQKAVGFGPAVKADAKAVPAQHSVSLRKGGFEPGITGVVENGAAVPRAVVHQVRRVGEDEIHARGGHLFHQVDTIALGDGIYPPRRSGKLDDLVGVHGVFSVSAPFSRGTPAKPARRAAPKARAAFAGRGPRLVM